MDENFNQTAFDFGTSTETNTSETISNTEEVINQETSYEDNLTPEDEPGLFDGGTGEEEDPNPEQSYIDRFLSNKGVDSTKIRIQNEDGTVAEQDFNSLSDDEKLAVLNSISEIAVTDDEIKTLNYLRQNKTNLVDYVKGQQEKAIQEYLAQNEDHSYTVDSYTDEELFKFELKNRYPNLTDQEIADEYVRQSANPDTFQKITTALREEYKKEEDEQAQQQLQEQQLKDEAEWEEMAGNVINVARSTDKLHDLKLTDDDKNEVLSFLLDRDVNGRTEFVKFLEDPKNLFKVAWYAKRGTDAFVEIDKYWQKQLASRNPARQTTKTVRRETKPLPSIAFQFK